MREAQHGRHRKAQRRYRWGLPPAAPRAGGRGSLVTTEPEDRDKHTAGIPGAAVAAGTVEQE